MSLFADRKYIEYIEVRPGTTNPEEMQRTSLAWMKVKYEYANDMIDYVLMRNIDMTPTYLDGSLNETEMYYYHHGKWSYLCTPKSLVWDPIHIPPEDVEDCCEEAYRLKEKSGELQNIYKNRHMISHKRSCIGTGD